MDDTSWFQDLTTEESKEERVNLSQRIIAILGTLCLIVLLLVAATWPSEARAQVPVHVLEQDGLVIRLMRGPCVEPNSKGFFSMAPEYASRAKALESVWRMQNGENKPFAGCWLELSAKESGGEEAIVLHFEDGERHVVPKSIFTKKSGQSGV